jgi:hypothetical protein
MNMGLDSWILDKLAGVPAQETALITTRLQRETIAIDTRAHGHAKSRASKRPLNAHKRA